MGHATEQQASGQVIAPCASGHEFGVVARDSDRVLERFWEVLGGLSYKYTITELTVLLSLDKEPCFKYDSRQNPQCVAVRLFKT